jgi:hypothetical protein
MHHAPCTHAADVRLGCSVVRQAAGWTWALACPCSVQCACECECACRNVHPDMAQSTMHNDNRSGKITPPSNTAPRWLFMFILILEIPNLPRNAGQCKCKRSAFATEPRGVFCAFCWTIPLCPLSDLSLCSCSQCMHMSELHVRYATCDIPPPGG